MSDLISRDNLSKYKEKLGCNEPLEVDAYYGGWNNAIDCIIENEPSAEPKKGKWVDIVEMDSGGYPFKVGVCCSACGIETLSEDNYCPHCGAKMK